MLVPKEVAIASADQAAALGLPAEETGILFAADDGGDVMLAGDAEYARTLQATPASALGGLVIPPEKFPISLRL